MSDTCCQDPTPYTPEARANPPGQSSLTYRAGRHASFKAAMKAALARKTALQGLTTRSDDDFAIALLDTSATVMDVLTFYQERIANEGYLRTAVERLSILELGRSIGYELRPGVAASTHLAFEIESAPGSPPVVTLDVGARAQSIPGPDEKPQTFETVEKIEARAEWNSLPAQTSLPFRPTRATVEIILQGTATNLKAGDFLLVVGDERLKNPASEQWDMRRIERVRLDAEKDLTRVTFDEPLGWELPPYAVNPAAKNVRAFAFRTRAALFGHNAPDWRLMPDDVRNRFITVHKKPHYHGAVTYTDWPGFDLDTSVPELDLDALYPAIVPGSWVVLSSPDYDELARVTGVSETSQANFGLALKVSHLTLEIENFDQFSHSRREALLYGQSEEMIIAESPLVKIPATAPSFGLELGPDALAPFEGGELLIERGTTDFPKGRALAVGGRRMRARVITTPLVLTAANGKTKSIAVGESLLLLEAPLRLQNGLTRLTLLDKAAFWGTANVDSGRVQLIASDPDDSTVNEVVLVERCALAGDEVHTRVELQKPLVNCFDRATVTIQGNLAPATQGETRREVLGSADAARAFQRFTLKQSPLTYISADTPSGAQSTLQVRVNDLLWDETGSIYATGPEDKIYTVRQNDQSKTSVQFGDGQSGARPHSGSENIVAVYRVGSGLAGNVAAGQISLLQSRPLGLKGVLNPLPASGGDDPEPRDQARRNAPLTTLTLDRLVSLQDYEDFTRAFAGIAKAQAVWLWDGGQRSVFITVSGPNGQPMTSGTRTYDSLVKAIQRYGLPFQPFQIVSYVPLKFGLQAGVQVDPRLPEDKVLEAVRQALKLGFGFAARELARGVAASQVLAVIQSVPGVVMADLNTLYLSGTTPSTSLPLPPLRAAPAHRDTAGIVHPAELLTLDESKLEILRVEKK
jgi:hypothetical protein